MRNAITLQNLRPLDQRSEKERLSLGRILAPRARFSFAHHREHGLWPQPKQEVCESSHESRTSGSSAHSQKFETITFVNSYSFIPSLRLRVYLAVARVRVLGAHQKESGLWARGSEDEDEDEYLRRVRRRVFRSEHAHFEKCRPPNLMRMLSTKISHS